jgi:hypothetical protein
MLFKELQKASKRYTPFPGAENCGKPVHPFLSSFGVDRNFNNINELMKPEKVEIVFSVLA